MNFPKNHRKCNQKNPLYKSLSQKMRHLRTHLPSPQHISRTQFWANAKTFLRLVRFPVWVPFQFLWRAFPWLWECRKSTPYGKTFASQRSKGPPTRSWGIPMARTIHRKSISIHYVKTSNRSRSICNGPLTPVTCTHICNGCYLAHITDKSGRLTPRLASIMPVTNVDFW
jgi:hypothetical protein